MLEFLIQILWIIATLMIFICGIYFSLKLKFIHLNFRKMFKEITKKQNEKNSISSYEALAMSLAGRIGVGSLSGIALAIYLGGPRSSFLDMAYIHIMCYKYICRKCASSSI